MNKSSFSVYNASAGSGKTFALVMEYLKIILTAKTNDAYRNILAITFTNKAVNEMKSRIVNSLSEFAKDNPNEKSYNLMQNLHEEIDLSVAEIKTKSQQIIKHIIHNYAGFDISTIDKFTHKIIRAFAHDLGLPMSFEVTLDSQNLLVEAVDTIIAQAGEDMILTKLLIDFTIEKTDNDKSWDISREFLETGKLILNENNRNEIAHFDGKKIEDFIEIKSKLISSIKSLETENSNIGKQAFEFFENNNINQKSFSNSTFPNHISHIINSDIREKNYNFTNIEEVKIKSKDKDTDLIISLLPKILDLLTVAYTNNQKKYFYKAFLKNITPLSLLNTISSELKKIQITQNLLSITEFNALIYKEIQNQPAPFIYERIGERYQHFFIDEFQDTSEMQWQNLIPLINNATSSSQIDGEKGTLMIVGDPKQSIYRWRGGKSEQFIELTKKKHPFNNPQIDTIYLNKNWRSYSQIVEFNNNFFEVLGNEFKNHDYKNLYLNHSKQLINNKIGGFVNISFIQQIESIESDDDNENDSKDKNNLFLLALLDKVQKCVNLGFEYKDIVVLTRKRKQGILIANYLTQEQIPILSSETLMIAKVTEVQFIIHLLKYLKNNKDKESKAYFLEYLAQDFQNTVPIHDYIAEGTAIENEDDFEKWLSGFGYHNSFKNLRKKSLYETVEIIITIFINKKTPQRLSNFEPVRSENAYVQYFLDIVLEQDIANQSSITNFLDYWSQNCNKFNIPSPEGTNAVRIMTIHKSKGLEFPVVIFPFAEENYYKTLKDKLWLDASEEMFGLPKILIDNSKAIESFNENAKLVYNQKKEEELLDNINVLYVALTRAEEQLYIISAMNLNIKNEPKENEMSSFFINYLKQNSVYSKDVFEYNFGKPDKLSPPDKHVNNTKNIKTVVEILNRKNIKIVQRESLMWGTTKQDSIDFGNVMHEILAFIKIKKDVDLAITKSIENGLITQNQKNIVLKTLQQIVNHQELVNYFDNKNEVFNEQTIIQKDGNTLKPDKMVLRKNKSAYLLDYKTGQQQSKHKLQLENYQFAIEKMGYKVIKKALIYIGEKIEVVNV